MEVLALAQLVNQEQQRYRCCQNVFHFTNQKTLEPTREVNVSQDGGVEGVRGGEALFIQRSSPLLRPVDAVDVASSI